MGGPGMTWGGARPSSGEAVTSHEKNACIHKNQRGTDVCGGTDPHGYWSAGCTDPWLLIAVKDLNVCTIQYGDNGLSCSR